MKIALDLQVQLKDGILILKSRDGSQRSCRSKENSNGSAGRTQQLDHRANLPAIPIQNQKILLRHTALRC